MIPALFKDSFRKANGDGEIILADQLQGRIFAVMDGEILHRLDIPLAEHPTDSFNNVGGNSLWPAPEGGAFAFNYPSDGGPWRVQDGINKAVSAVHPETCGMSRKITLENRKGISAEMTHSREITFPACGFGKKYGVKSLVYASTDSLELTNPLPAEDFLVSAWSLEQFDLTPRAVAFGTMTGAMNTDFYGNPGPFLTQKGGSFRFDFKAPEKLQIGIPEQTNPGMIGAYVPERDLLIVRRIVRTDAGKRINFADNEQPDGVYSAADAYSVFYGAEMNFFELETLAPVRIRDSKVSGSLLETETHFYRGAWENLKALLRNEFNFNTEVL